MRRKEDVVEIGNGKEPITGISKNATEKGLNVVFLSSKKLPQFCRSQTRLLVFVRQKNTQCWHTALPSCTITRFLCTQRLGSAGSVTVIKGLLSYQPEKMPPKLLRGHFPRGLT